MSIRITALEGIPEIVPGQALDEVLATALEQNGVTIGNRALLLPEFPGRSAASLRSAIERRLGVQAAAVMAMGEADEGRPIVVISGLPTHYFDGNTPASALIRPIEKELS